MSLDRLFEEARARMGATREERLERARARTEELNKELARQFSAQAVSKDLLAKTCSL
ncbi:TPA: hypothetical protein L4V00_000187 [Pseudomonas aeruginosa]|uniref:hypothetical protein n=1 Tax=Pseudomonas aeruginosa TaxID=287 RepID=UPI00208E7551|nr:hypothetical protein [Pseudomonas aeruginosa]UUH88016.1 hypothetical protein NP444_03620 [Pseudomonas aeruginosa]HBO4309876.1 hypothetical protein [Pseudomonas aeruginosa]HBO4702813.1 hypothetical protein [Pseudomonas aeruginosa]HCR1326670.1 hypothetical protein [Pseudomonas aeruginosa]